MHKKTFFLILSCFLLLLHANAQELNARVSVLSNRVGTSVDKKVFNTLQTQLSNFLNTRKWSNDVYRTNEKIECSFIINIESVMEPNVYKASLHIQVARPVFNASYNSALVNFQDPDFLFKYVEFQPVEFNDTRVQGTDAGIANLTAVFAFYAYTIVGLDNDSFSPKSGEPNFNKAQNIVTNSPEGKSISGWRVFDGLRNRYWLNENLSNSRYNIIHDVIYTYYRGGLDKMYESEDEARSNIIQALTQLRAFNKENPNTMILQFFMQGKAQELIGIFKNAMPPEKSRVVEILSEIDIVNASKYKQELQ
ncbi:MAG: DUF4835 family protein [Chitinophagaceae bacterium]|nr:DUF4835 family protein [Chitinophagaceae bacterium]